MIAEATTTAYRKHWFGDDGASAHRGDDGVWPVYHGRSFNLWKPDTGDYYDSCDAKVMAGLLQARRQNPTSASPYAKFSEEHLAGTANLPCFQPRIAVRDITSPTNTRTLIAALIPSGRILTQHAAHILLTETGEAKDEAFAVGVLASMVCDWQARRRVEMHMANAEILGGLSVPLRQDNPICDRIIEIAGRLSASDARFETWASQVGVLGESLDDGERDALITELDALVAILYGLNEHELTLLFETFAGPQRWHEHRAAVVQRFTEISASLNA